MADQNVRVTNFPESSSYQRVALDLVKYVLDHSTEARETKTPDEILDLYHKCLDATYGRRK